MKWYTNSLFVFLVVSGFIVTMEEKEHRVENPLFKVQNKDLRRKQKKRRRAPSPPPKKLTRSNLVKNLRASPGLTQQASESCLLLSEIQKQTIILASIEQRLKNLEFFLITQKFEKNEESEPMTYEEQLTLLEEALKL